MEDHDATCIPTWCIYFKALVCVELHVFMYPNEVNSHHLFTITNCVAIHQRKQQKIPPPSRESGYTKPGKYCLHLSTVGNPSHSQGSQVGNDTFYTRLLLLQFAIIFSPIRRSVCIAIFPVLAIDDVDQPTCILFLDREPLSNSHL